jgi:hypothetical protein
MPGSTGDVHIMDKMTVLVHLSFAVNIAFEVYGNAITRLSQKWRKKSQISHK